MDFLLVTNVRTLALLRFHERGLVEFPGVFGHGIAHGRFLFHVPILHRCELMYIGSVVHRETGTNGYIVVLRSMHDRANLAAPEGIEPSYLV